MKSLNSARGCWNVRHEFRKWLVLIYAGFTSIYYIQGLLWTRVFLKTGQGLPSVCGNRKSVLITPLKRLSDNRSVKRLANGTNYVTWLCLVLNLLQNYKMHFPIISVFLIVHETNIVLQHPVALLCRCFPFFAVHKMSIVSVIVPHACPVFSIWFEYP
jgi:hypothetical protein